MVLETIAVFFSLLFQFYVYYLAYYVIHNFLTFTYVTFGHLQKFIVSTITLFALSGLNYYFLLVGYWCAILIMCSCISFVSLMSLTDRRCLLCQTSKRKSKTKTFYQ